MVEYPYHKVAAKKLPDFFKTIQTQLVPQKIDKRYIKVLGFKSSYDEKIPHILRCLGFVDSNHVPTSRWLEYRDSNRAPAVMATAIKNDAYKQLFETHNDAHLKDDETLRNFFKYHTKDGEEIVNKKVETFKTLCSLANFEEIEDDTQSASSESPKTEKLVEKIPNVELQNDTGKCVVNINVQLQLPPSTDSQVYDKLFESMKKHLFSA